MALTAADWPITAALLQFPGVKRDGSIVQDADSAEWVAVFSEVAEAGFSAVDITDSWIRPGDCLQLRASSPTILEQIETGPSDCSPVFCPLEG